MDKKELEFSNAVTLIANQKLEIACKIAKITPDQTTAGLKHINVYEVPGLKVWTYAEKRIPLVTVKFTDSTVKIRRLRKFQYFRLNLAWFLRKLFKRKS
jgi:hypothetical protein